MDSRYTHLRYELRRQFWKFAGASVRIYDEQENLMFFAEQKAWKLKEDFRLYGDEGKRQELLRMAARKILDFSGAYDVYDSADGQKIGVFKRKGLSSAFLRDNWIIMDAQEREIGQIIENKPFMAFLRRWIDFVSLLSPQCYTIEVQGRKVGELRQNWNPFLYKLSIDFSEDRAGLLDRRLGIGAVILMATLEGKQRG